MSATLTINSESSRGGFASRLLGRMKAVSQNLQSVAKADVNLESVTSATKTLTSATQAIGRFFQKKAVDTIQAIKNSSTEDKLFWATNIAVGAAAKAFVLSSVATGGLPLVAIAAAGGFITGATRTGMNVLRAYRNNEQDKLTLKHVGRQLLMNTVSGGAISAGTCGLLGGIESLTGTKLSDVFARCAGHGLAMAKTAFMNMIPDAEAAGLPRISRPAPIMRLTTPVMAQPVKDSLAELIKVRDSSVSVRPTVTIASPTVNQANIDALTLQHLRDLIKNTTGVAPSSNLTSRQLAEQFYPKHPDALLNSIQKNIKTPSISPVVAPSPSAAFKVPEVTSAPAPAISPSSPEPILAQYQQADGTVKTVQMPPKADLRHEWVEASMETHRLEMDRIARQDYEAKFGMTPDPSMTTEDIAKKINPDNPSQYVDDRSGDADTMIAERLPQAKMRGACLADLPASEDSHQQRDRVLPNTCVVPNEADIQKGEYITVRDVGAEKVGKASRFFGKIRVIFAGAQAPVSEFIDGAVGDNTVKEMTAEKLAMAPQ